MKTFTVGNFSMEVDVVEIQIKRQTTSRGNIFCRVKIRDESREAILVVWGDEHNHRNVDIFAGYKIPKRIRITYPVKPLDYYIERYGVDLWAHQDITVIDVLETKTNDTSAVRRRDKDFFDFLEDEDYGLEPGLY